MDEKLDFKFSKYDLNFLIRLKIHEFRKQDIQNIDEQQIKSFLFDYKWKHKKSIPMCELVNDIMNLEFSEIFDYLSIQAVKEANTLDLTNFKDLISK
ncbi:MAG: post-transcriptional regulator [Faecalibacillus sp.]